MDSGCDIERFEVYFTREWERETPLVSFQFSHLEADEDILEQSLICQNLLLQAGADPTVGVFDELYGTQLDSMVNMTLGGMVAARRTTVGVCTSTQHTAVRTQKQNNNKQKAVHSCIYPLIQLHQTSLAHPRIQKENNTTPKQQRKNSSASSLHPPRSSNTRANQQTAQYAKKKSYQLNRTNSAAPSTTWFLTFYKLKKKECNKISTAKKKKQERERLGIPARNAKRFLCFLS